MRFRHCSGDVLAEAQRRRGKGISNVQQGMPNVQVKCASGIAPGFSRKDAKAGSAEHQLGIVALLCFFNTEDTEIDTEFF